MIYSVQIPDTFYINPTVVVAYEWCFLNLPIKTSWWYQGNGKFEFCNKLEFLLFLVKFA